MRVVLPPMTEAQTEGWSALLDLHAGQNHPVSVQLRAVVDP